MFFNNFEWFIISFLAWRVTFSKLFSSWENSLQITFWVHCNENMDSRSELGRVNSWESPDFIVSKRMHPNGHARILSLIRISYPYLRSHVILNKFICICRNEWKKLNFIKITWNLWIRIPIKIKQSNKRSYNQEKMQSNYELINVYVSRKLTL